ncbi:MAG TPA: hypothetical protein VFM37_05985 [Pseudonocardiaceae bacterium]|nr:hypothetical protein [Pseudonocardiaceae bacterium]
MTDPEEREPAAEFEQFWAQHATARAPERITVVGAEITVPNDLPLDVERRAEQLGDSDDPDDVRELLTMLFGDDVLERWVANGMTIRQFQFMLAWAFARGSGRRVTFAEFWPEFEALEAGGGKANRAQRRAAKRKKGKAGSSPTRGSATAGR